MKQYKYLPGPTIMGTVEVGDSYTIKVNTTLWTNGDTTLYISSGVFWAQVIVSRVQLTALQKLIGDTLAEMPVDAAEVEVA
ncbi:MAG: hypothetical protein H0W48_00240 [Methylibium sp.]|nr:hypothetical protein [Methylibium sp.]